MNAELYDEPVFRIIGDQGILMELGNGIDSHINQSVQAAMIVVEQAQLNGVIEIIPTYRSMVVVYDPLVTTFFKLKDSLSMLSRGLSQANVPPRETVEIPVCYGGKFGEDLDFVATSHNLSTEEVIRLHSEADYLVYMLGFTPGFPFLGGLPKILHTQRLATPRNKVPAGSVGIANSQTGIYPIDSPGGWQLIGRVPIKIFDPAREDPFMLKAGNLLKFKPISLKEYHTLAGKAENGSTV